MTHQDVGDAEVLPDLLDQILADTPIDIVGGDGAYDTRQCRAVIAARKETPSIPRRDGANHWSNRTLGAAWRNYAIEVVAKSSRRDWKWANVYNRRSLAETLNLQVEGGYPQEHHGTRDWCPGN